MHYFKAICDETEYNRNIIYRSLYFMPFSSFSGLKGVKGRILDLKTHHSG